ncbi:DsbA family protein [Nocardioides alkalitolerans]|uniref:DsbA family protein n=1 Tax=Nocardioides alkalitolerans TaxID=281714 RepID=UPI0003F97F50|nr:thioredoxin domain-containing protein [Nocardioides alkalitolerans]
MAKAGRPNKGGAGKGGKPAGTGPAKQSAAKRTTGSATTPPKGGPTRAQKAQAAQREQARKERLREWTIVGSVIAVVAALIIGVVLLQGGDEIDPDAAVPGSGQSESSADPGATDPTAPATDLPGEVTEDYGIAFGDPDAEHRVVIYEDFICPFCGALEAETSDDLTALAASGDIVVEYRAFNLLTRFGDYSERAANAFAVVMDAAGPAAAKEFHDALFEEQPSESGPYLSDDDLVDLAVAAGAEESAVRPGIEDLSFGDWVSNATIAAEDNDVTGTPTVLVDGESIGGQTVADLADNIFSAVGGRP